MFLYLVDTMHGEQIEVYEGGRGAWDSEKTNAEMGSWPAGDPLPVALDVADTESYLLHLLKLGKLTHGLKGARLDDWLTEKIGELYWLDYAGAVGVGGFVVHPLFQYVTDLRIATRGDWWGNPPGHDWFLRYADTIWTAKLIDVSAGFEWYFERQISPIGRFWLHVRDMPWRWGFGDWFFWGYNNYYLRPGTPVIGRQYLSTTFQKFAGKVAQVNPWVFKLTDPQQWLQEEVRWRFGLPV